MAVRSALAPKPWSKPLAEPQIDETAYVHSFANVVGDVRLQRGVNVAPGSSLRADEGSPFWLGPGVWVQHGVVIHGLAQGRVLGDDQQEYSVWIGARSCLAHLAMVHGPVYIGADCFIGFRSTVFNARVGAGAVVMMHALVQNVEIPPGKLVPSGALITQQSQADNLPDVQEGDRRFVQHITQWPSSTTDPGQIISGRSPVPDSGYPAATPITETPYSNHSTDTMTMNSDISNQIRSLLAQGYSIGGEYANERRFKTKSWQSCGVAEGYRPEQVINTVEGWLQEHAGEYVRLIGIDQGAKRRVVEVIVQRPGDAPGSPARPTKAPRAISSSNGTASTASGSGAGTDASSQLRALIHQGCKIGVEYANARRFKTSSWLTAGTLTSRRESEALQELNRIIADHRNEYVRIIGVDPQAKRRVAEVVVYRPEGNGAVGASGGNSVQNSYSSSASSGSAAATGLTPEVMATIRQLLANGYTIGTEHTDKRRFKAKSWETCAPITSTREGDVFRALEGCLADHAGEYVRLIGIDRNAKRRVLEQIIQRPDNGNGSTPGRSPLGSNNGKGSSETSGTNAGYSNSAVRLSGEVVTQVRSLLAQGLKISTEHTDKRRFKAKSWQSCAPITSTHEGEVLRALEGCLADHSGEYVRLLGIDPAAKRRVVETIIQRP